MKGAGWPVPLLKKVLDGAPMHAMWQGHEPKNPGGIDARMGDAWPQLLVCRLLVLGEDPNPKTLFDPHHADGVREGFRLVKGSLVVLSGYPNDLVLRVWALSILQSRLKERAFGLVG